MAYRYFIVQQQQAEQRTKEKPDFKNDGMPNLTVAS